MEQESIVLKLLRPTKKTIIICVALLGIITIVLVSFFLLKSHNRTLVQAERSVYINFTNQINGISSYLSYVTLNDSIEQLMDIDGEDLNKVIENTILVKGKMEEMSLFPVMQEVNGKQMKINYTISLIVEKESPFYQFATSELSFCSGIFKSNDLTNKEWYIKLKERPETVQYWAEDFENNHMFFAATNKFSKKTGKQVVTYIIGVSVDNLRFMMNQMQEEYSVSGIVLDEKNRVIIGGLNDFKQKGIEETLILPKQVPKLILNQGKIGYAQQSVFANGWKLLVFIPITTLWKYWTLILIIGVGMILALVYVLRKIIERRTFHIISPVLRLANFMTEISNEGTLQEMNIESNIVEINRLYNGYNKMSRKINDLINKLYLTEIEKNRLQIYSMQMQINPHFLYNTLDIISCMAISGDVEVMGEAIGSLANFFRYGLNKGRYFHKLEDELKQIKSYMNIQMIMNTQLRVDYVIDEQLYEKYVLNFIIQPLVENAILHGFRNKTQDCCIEISALMECERLYISIKDNGCGVNVESFNKALYSDNSVKKGGFGIINVHKRLKLQFGEGFGVKYIPTEIGTHATIICPLLDVPPKS